MLTRRDLGGTIVVALVALTYAANVEGWWFLGNNRWAAVTMGAVAAIGCPLGARADVTRASAPVVMLGVLGLAALVLAIVAIVSAAQWALLAFAIVIAALWVGTTLRHSVTSPPPLAAR